MHSELFEVCLVSTEGNLKAKSYSSLSERGQESIQGFELLQWVERRCRMELICLICIRNSRNSTGWLGTVSPASSVLFSVALRPQWETVRIMRDVLTITRDVEPRAATSAFMTDTPQSWRPLLTNNSKVPRYPQRDRTYWLGTGSPVLFSVTLRPQRTPYGLLPGTESPGRPPRLLRWHTSWDLTTTVLLQMLLYNHRDRTDYY